MSADYSTFGDLLAQLRLEAGFQNQADLAKVIDAAQQTVSRWEAGRSRPRLSQIGRLADVLKADAETLAAAARYTPATQTVTFDRPFPLEALSPESFERFCQKLVEVAFPEADVHGHGAAGHKQDGLDILATWPDGRRMTFQCKRESNFGPAKVLAAIGKHTAKADKKVILLSRIASPQAREAIAKHQDWELWDQEDISRRLRDLPKEELKRFVRIFFRSQEVALLGESAASPWESLEEFFRVFEDSQILFNHQWALVGRDKEIANLRARLEDTGLQTIFLVGSGGTGKSRLLKHVLQSYAEAHPTIVIRLLSRDGELSRPSLEELTSGRLLLVIDDAHDRSDLQSVFEFAAVNRDRVRIIVSTRPYGYDRHHQQALRLSLLPTDLAAVELSPLSLAEAELLAKQVLASQPHPDGPAREIARLTYDCPLATVVAAQIIGMEPRQVALIGQEGRFRAAVFKRFEEVIAGHIGRPEDASALHALMRFIALVQPVSLEDDRTWAAYSTFAGSKSHETIRLLGLLTQAGVLFRRGQSYRLSPDVLADHLIEDQCVAVNGTSTGYAEQVFDLIGERLLGQLLLNLARLDWRRKEGNSDESPLLDGVWRKLNPGDEAWDAQMDIITDVAFYQPRRCLDLVHRKLLDGSKSPKLAKICRHAAYNYNHLQRSLEYLWELGKDDEREENQHPEHPIRILKELAEIEPQKPLAYNEAVIEFGIALAQEPDIWQRARTPLDFLRGIFATEGHQTASERHKIVFSPFFVSPEVARSLRVRVIDLLLRLLIHADAAVGVKAAKVLHDALRYPMGAFGASPAEDTREEWRVQFVRLLERVLGLVQSNALHPAVQVELSHAVSWHAGYGDDETSLLAQKILNSFEMSLEARADRALADGYGMHRRLRNVEVDEAEWADSLVSLATELLATHPDKSELCQFIEARLDSLGRVAKRDTSSAYVLIDKILAADTGFCRAVVAMAHETPDAHISGYAAFALSYLFQADAANYRKLVGQFAGSRHRSHLLIAANAVGFRSYDESNTTLEDLSLIRKLVQNADDHIVHRAVRAIRMLAKSDAEAAKNLALSVSMKSESVADEVAALFAFGDDLSLGEFTDTELVELLQRFKELPELGGHWMQKLLSDMSLRIPEDCLDFFTDRIEMAARERGEGRIRPINHGPWLQARMKFRSTPIAQQLMTKYIQWWRNAGEGWPLNYYGRSAFEAFFGPFDDELVLFLEGWASTAGEEDMYYIASILREADASFIFRYESFLSRFVGKARQYGVKVGRMVTSELYAAAISGVRTGVSGEPFPQDIELRAKCVEALDRLGPFSPLRELYQSLLRHTDAEIKRAVLDAEEDEI